MGLCPFLFNKCASHRESVSIWSISSLSDRYIAWPISPVVCVQRFSLGAFNLRRQPKTGVVAGDYFSLYFLCVCLSCWAAVAKEPIGRRTRLEKAERSAIGNDDVEKKENRKVAFYLVVVAIPTPIVNLSMLL